MFDCCSWRGVLDITLCDKVCQGLATGQWFSTGTLVSSTNKADRNNITEILLKSGVKHHKPKPNLSETRYFFSSFFVDTHVIITLMQIVIEKYESNSQTEYTCIKKTGLHGSVHQDMVDWIVWQ